MATFVANNDEKETAINDQMATEVQCLFMMLGACIMTSFSGLAMTSQFLEGHMSFEDDRVVLHVQMKSDQEALCTSKEIELDQNCQLCCICAKASVSQLDEVLGRLALGFQEEWTKCGLRT